MYTHCLAEDARFYFFVGELLQCKNRTYASTKKEKNKKEKNDARLMLPVCLTIKCFAVKKCTAISYFSSPADDRNTDPHKNPFCSSCGRATCL